MNKVAFYFSGIIKMIVFINNTSRIDDCSLKRLLVGLNANRNFAVCLGILGPGRPALPFSFDMLRIMG